MLNVIRRNNQSCFTEKQVKSQTVRVRKSLQISCSNSYYRDQIHRTSLYKVTFLKRLRGGGSRSGEAMAPAPCSPRQLAQPGWGARPVQGCGRPASHQGFRDGAACPLPLSSILLLFLFHSLTEKWFLCCLVYY